MVLFVIEYILFFVGIFLLIKGADYLIDGASSLAKRLGISTLVIGLTIVAFGTSAPELVVNIIAAIQGATEISFGNIIGSNISNILLVLGITALITEINIKKTTTWKEIPFTLLSVLVLIILANKFLIDKTQSFSLLRTDGLILLSFFAIYLFYSFGLVIKSRKKSQKKKLKIPIPERNILLILTLILGGILGLYLGGKWTVEGAIYIAKQFGLSEFLISATIIALGTSLPELVTSIRAALKKDVDLAVGNIIGSNIFNILWILGITALINPISIPSFINIDLIILFGATFLLFVTMFTGKKHKLEKWEGIIFILFYLAYFAFLIIRG